MKGTHPMTTHTDIETILQSALTFRYEDAHLEIDIAEKTAFLDSQRLQLTHKEYDLLFLLVQNAGEVVRREVLLMRVWGYCSAIRTRTLDVHIRRLRRHLGPYSDQYIETIFGIGYRFQSFRTARRFETGTLVLESRAARQGYGVDKTS
jgi:DNA-binding response OmpR family regulator